MSLDRTEDIQKEYYILLDALEKSRPRNPYYIKSRIKLLDNAEKFCDGKEMIRSEYNNNKLKISAPTWNDDFSLPDGSYSVSDVQDYFEYIIKKHETIAYNPK